MTRARVRPTTTGSWPNAEALRELGFVPVAAVRSEGPDARVVDLYHDGDRIVVAVDRTSGSTTVLTELVGFRVLVTTALLVPPTDELVVNVVADGDTPGLVLSHQRLVRQAFRSRTLPSEPVGLFKLAQQRELQAYRGLGARWGALIDLRCRPRGVRLLAAPSAGEVLLFTGNKRFARPRAEWRLVGADGSGGHGGPRTTSRQRSHHIAHTGRIAGDVPQEADSMVSRKLVGTGVALAAFSLAGVAGAGVGVKISGGGGSSRQASLSCPGGMTRLGHVFDENGSIFEGDPVTEIEQVTSIAVEGYLVERVTTGSHNGTHLDAPGHFFSRMAGRIDELQAQEFVWPRT